MAANVTQPLKLLPRPPPTKGQPGLRGAHFFITGTLQPRTTYNCTAQAYTAAGEQSPLSQKASFTTPLPQSPPPPPPVVAPPWSSSQQPGRQGGRPGAQPGKPPRGVRRSLL